MEVSSRMTQGTPANTALVESLTPRRREVLELLTRGLTNDEIARILSISPATVRTLLTSVFSHLEVTNRTEAAALCARAQADVDHVREIIERPAIAVLPLVAMDPVSQTVAAGLTHDLIGLFGRWCCFPVIASTSSAHAREWEGGCRELGRRLGARFLVNADLRRRQGHFRLNVRIEDAKTERTLWVERYTFPIDDVFEVQDTVTEGIVAAAYPLLLAHVAARPRARAGTDTTAWELTCEGIALEATRERDANAQARSRFQAALKRDSSLVLAHFGLGLCCYSEILNQWGPPERALEGLAASAERCVRLAPWAAEGYYLLGRHFQTRGDHASAVHPLEIAIGHNPSFAAAHSLLAQALALAGRSDEGLVRMGHAIRLGGGSYMAGLATLHLVRGEYDAALEATELSLATTPRYTYARLVAVASAWWLGRHERAAEHWRTLRSQDRSFATAEFLATFGSNVDAVERIVRAVEAIERGN
jgi:adenylate cyclase